MWTVEGMKATLSVSVALELSGWGSAVILTESDLNGRRASRGVLLACLPAACLDMQVSGRQCCAVSPNPNHPLVAQPPTGVQLPPATGQGSAGQSSCLWVPCFRTANKLSWLCGQKLNPFFFSSWVSDRGDMEGFGWGPFFVFGCNVQPFLYFGVCWYHLIPNSFRCTEQNSTGISPLCFSSSHSDFNHFFTPQQGCLHTWDTCTDVSVDEQCWICFTISIRFHLNLLIHFNGPLGWTLNSNTGTTFVVQHDKPEWVMWRLTQDLWSLP